ncbi:hypothetical protein ACFPRL_14745 [Pseudoclavibacter helvolus]
MLRDRPTEPRQHLAQAGNGATVRDVLRLHGVVYFPNPRSSSFGCAPRPTAS